MNHSLSESFKQYSLMAGGSHYPSINSQHQEQFGRLIVEQCIEICNKLADESSHNSIARECAINITRHFNI